ncbi:MAG: galactokinase [Eubacteriaceae bacterium]|nr:galactokinase [Eubacteriaceae bacterium]
MEQNERETKRRRALKEKYLSTFGKYPEALISSPGRSEIIGNHTDHQCGCVITSAVNIDILSACGARGDMTVCIHSEGFAPFSIDISDTAPIIGERGQTAALVRGVAFRLSEAGHKIGGFNAAVVSDVASGSGLSSSAAVENLIVKIFCVLFGNELSPLEAALISKAAENDYFGKPCGLEDQLSSALGGINFIDFADLNNPVIRPVNADFADFGHRLVITHTGKSHHDLTDDYSKITEEMGNVSRFFGVKYLRQVNEETFFGKLSEVKRVCGERAALRAIHFFAENKRSNSAACALEEGRFDEFLRLVRESGQSSFMYLQNVYSPADAESQGLSLALALSGVILGKAGAYRVHGGGFAGTISAIVPESLCGEYIGRMEGVFGVDSCKMLTVRREGPVELPL